MVKNPVVLKLLCAAFVVCLMLPLGSMVFPYLGVPPLLFTAVEAVISATLGFGIAGFLGSA